jgi:hypothetical protein
MKSPQKELARSTGTRMISRIGGGFGAAAPPLPGRISAPTAQQLAAVPVNVAEMAEGHAVFAYSPIIDCAGVLSGVLPPSDQPVPAVAPVMVWAVATAPNPALPAAGAEGKDHVGVSVEAIDPEAVACTIAPEPFVPEVSTPVYCITYHMQPVQVDGEVIVMPPAEGLADMPRNRTVVRVACGVVAIDV